MRVSRIHIKKFRCLDDVDLQDISDYTALVGPNGSGKSSVLYALDWFFNGNRPKSDDFHSSGESEYPTERDEIDIEVVFSDLSAEDRRVLGKYGRGETARFRRTFNCLGEQEKIIGNASQFAEFNALRQVSNRVAQMRPIYRELRGRYSSLAEVDGKEEMLDELAKWEGDPCNEAHLEEVEATDASHMFGFAGESVLADRVRFVLVPASADLVNQIGTSGKTSAVSALIGALLDTATTAATQHWETQNADKLQELRQAIHDGIEQNTQLQSGRVNSLFQELVPNAEISLNPTVSPFSTKVSASVSTQVSINGAAFDVSRHGHGVQRAVMIAMLQAIVPTERPLADVGEDPSGESPLELTDRPSVIIGIEEPEIYQHPVRARHFARVLVQWANQPCSQVIIATHSPLFLSPEQFSSIRRLTVQAGSTVVARSSLMDVARRAGITEEKVFSVAERELPKVFSEGFFADAAVFVEGESDRSVIESVAQRLGLALDARGISVICIGGKESLKTPSAILASLGIPVYIVADGDALSAAKKHAVGTQKYNDALKTHSDSTSEIISWLPQATAIVGSLPYAFGDPTVITSHWTLWQNDLETELANWASFCETLRAAGSNLSSKSSTMYRSSAMVADLEDLPINLERAIRSIASFLN